MSINAVRVPKASELVASDIRRRIVNGSLEEGEALPSESELMERYGVSRPTLREALRVLESETLIEIRRGSHGGARITKPSAHRAAHQATLLLQMRGATIHDVLQVATYLEPPAARRIAEQRDSEVIDQLEEIVENEDRVIHDVEEYASFSNVLHLKLLELAGSPTLWVLGQLLSEILDLSIHASAAESKVRGAEPEVKKAHDDHIRLVELLRAGAALESEEHWRRHLMSEAVQDQANIGDIPLRDLL